MIPGQKVDHAQSFRQLLEMDGSSSMIDMLEKGESRYLKDLKVNFKNILRSEYLTDKEVMLTALSCAVTLQDSVLIDFFRDRCSNVNASAEEIGEAVACGSLLSANNILYRFRHFIQKDEYARLPAKIKMNIMMRPVSGKAFFELMSLAVSAVNGCEMCVRSHEKSLKDMEVSDEKIWDAIRIASIVAATGKVV